MCAALNPAGMESDKSINAWAKRQGSRPERLRWRRNASPAKQRAFSYFNSLFSNKKTQKGFQNKDKEPGWHEGAHPAAFLLALGGRFEPRARHRSRSGSRPLRLPPPPVTRRRKRRPAPAAQWAERCAATGPSLPGPAAGGSEARAGPGGGGALSLPGTRQHHAL